MADLKKKPLSIRIQAGLANEHTKAGRRRGFRNIKAGVPGAAAQVPHLQGEVRAMKLAALHDRALVDTAIERLRANGCQVYLAATAAEARDYILRVCAQPGVLIKSKSNAVKELAVREPLESRGITWIDTDMGDWINQLAGVEGAHLLAPAIQHTREDVARIFGEWLGETLPSDPTELVAAARKGLRLYLEGARYGMTGANAIAAAEGVVVLMENEGNIRAVTAMSPVHIVVAGINKVVPTLTDAIKVVQAQSVYGVAQDFGTYCTTLTGPAPAGGFGPAEVHVVLVDNGRSAAIERGYAEAFTCLNCGSCLNFCPVYGVAGDGYSHKMMGGIGALQESLITGLVDPATGRLTGGAQLLDLCLGCTKCIEYCPTGIDTPHLTQMLKAETYAHRPMPTVVQQVLNAVREPARLRRMSGLLRFYQQSGLRKVLRPLMPRKLRELEAMAPEVRPLGEWPAVQPALGPERGKVAFFLGCIMAATMGDIHHATARVLRRAGFTVVTPEFRGCCGALHEHAGEFTAAKEMAKAVIAGFETCPDLPVVINSAGCGALLKKYGELLAGDPAWAERASRFARRVVDFSEFLAQVGLGPAASAPAAGRRTVRVTYQDACHLACAQGITAQPRELLRAVPGVELAEMVATEACCGSAGIYGLGGEAQAGVSMALLAEKLEDAAATEAEVVVTANPGCLMHLRYGAARDGKGFEVLHLAEFLDRMLGGGEQRG